MSDSSSNDSNSGVESDDYNPAGPDGRKTPGKSEKTGKKRKRNELAPRVTKARLCKTKSKGKTTEEIDNFNWTKKRNEKLHEVIRDSGETTHTVKNCKAWSKALKEDHDLDVSDEKIRGHLRGKAEEDWLENLKNEFDEEVDDDELQEASSSDNDSGAVKHDLQNSNEPHFWKIDFQHGSLNVLSRTISIKKNSFSWKELHQNKIRNQPSNNARIIISI